jgi:hypothetical protein
MAYSCSRIENRVENNCILSPVRASTRNFIWVSIYYKTVRMKKLINDPSAVVDEMLDGFIQANHNQVRRLQGNDVVVRDEAPIDSLLQSPKLAG